MTDFEIGWAAGFFEGEGCFSFSGTTLSMSIKQVDIEPLMHFQSAVGGAGKIYVDAKHKPHPIYQWRLTGIHQVTAVANLIFLGLSKRRQLALAAALTKRSVSLKGHFQSRKTHCPKGHPYDESSWVRNGDRRQRQCRICRNERERARYQRLHVVEEATS